MAIESKLLPSFTATQKRSTRQYRAPISGSATQPAHSALSALRQRYRDDGYFPQVENTQMVLSSLAWSEQAFPTLPLMLLRCVFRI
jgi:hypothetical protein